MHAVRVILATIVSTLFVALAGALAGGVIAIALTSWVVPDDPFAIVVFGAALLLLWVPLGAIVAVWMLSRVWGDRAE